MMRLLPRIARRSSSSQRCAWSFSSSVNITGAAAFSPPSTLRLTAPATAISACPIVQESAFSTSTSRPAFKKKGQIAPIYMALPGARCWRCGRLMALGTTSMYETKGNKVLRDKLRVSEEQQLTLVHNPQRYCSSNCRKARFSMATRRPQRHNLLNGINQLLDIAKPPDATENPSDKVNNYCIDTRIELKYLELLGDPDKASSKTLIECGQVERHFFPSDVVHGVTLTQQKRGMLQARQREAVRQAARRLAAFGVIQSKVPELTDGSAGYTDDFPPSIMAAKAADDIQVGLSTRNKERADIAYNYRLAELERRNDARKFGTNADESHDPKKIDIHDLPLPPRVQEEIDALPFPESVKIQRIEPIQKGEIVETSRAVGEWAIRWE